METGTQGSIDGYLISIYIGIILSVAIIIIQIFKRNNHGIISKIIYLLLLAFGLLLYIINFKFLYYVTIRGYTVNDVITNAMDYGLAVVSNDNEVEKFYPIIVYLIISINVIVCFINIRTKKQDGNGNCVKEKHITVLSCYTSSLTAPRVRRGQNHRD
jgi:hypothetical protein